MITRLSQINQINLNKELDVEMLNSVILTDY